MFAKFSRDLPVPGQNVKLLLFLHNNRYLVIVQIHCWNYLLCEGLSKSFIILLNDRAYLYDGAQIKKNRYTSPNPTLNVAQTVTLALILTQT